MPLPPNSEHELLTRAQAMIGIRFSQLADQANMAVPENLKREKGWVGQLLEWHLGADSGNKSQPDFAHLGIELKTIPIGYHGRPLETTFVTLAPLSGIQGITWETSHVKQKLSKVLWIPIEGERDIPLADRRVGHPLLWTPTPQEEAQLKQDWEELMESIVLGKVEQITAKQGEVMQLRPKAANSQAVTVAYDKNGAPIKALPRGFYLRTQFTQQILEQHLYSSHSS